MNNMIFFATLVFNSVVFNLPVHAQEKSETMSLESQLQTKLDNIVGDGGFPGATLAVVLKDGTTFDLASGFEDPESKKKMGVGSIMFCGSTGKTFVSAVGLQLIAEGKFALDDLAAKYFDSDEDREWFFRLPNSKTITVRSLMNHTSGLPRYLFQSTFLDDLKKNPRESRNPKDGLLALQGAEAIHEVGEGWAYSDSNYLVLGLIIEKVSGKTYYEIARERILEPLELIHTKPATQPKIDGLIQGHIGSINPFELPSTTLVDGEYVMNPKFEWCGGGYVTNVRDMAMWLHALHSGQVLNEETYAQLIEPVEFRTGKPGKQGYGLGTFVWQTPNGLFFGHAGIMPGYLTQIEFSKEHEFAIAMQINSDEGMGQRLHDQVQAVAALIISESK